MRVHVCSREAFLRKNSPFLKGIFTPGRVCICSIQVAVGIFIHDSFERTLFLHTLMKFNIEKTPMQIDDTWQNGRIEDTRLLVEENVVQTIVK